MRKIVTITTAGVCVSAALLAGWSSTLAEDADGEQGTKSFAPATSDPAANTPVADKGEPSVSLTPQKTGTFWYAMHDSNSKTDAGYVKFNAQGTKAGGVHIDWELHIAFPGGTHEEARAVTFDKAGLQTFSETVMGGKRVIASRAGKVWAGKNGIEDFTTDTAETAVTGMGFLLAAWLPLSEGTKLVRNERNEAHDLKDLGDCTFTVGKKETVELHGGMKAEAWKITRMPPADAKRPGLTMWVNDAREIVQVDWGGGNLMRLSATPTEGLFKKPDAAKGK